ncbi:MAG: hypothetical protein ACOC4G_08460, partial [Bacillota bacterium]
MQNLYTQIYSWPNLILAWKKARKGKTKRDYIIKFDKNLKENLKKLRSELMAENYSPRPLETFSIKDPKTRLIS